jgi:hypothetical protein
MQITDPDYSIVLFRAGPTTCYQWVAAGPNPCPRCAELDGSIRSLSSWESSVIPGFHKHCHCKLVPVNVADPGMVFTYQFTHLTMADILNTISAMFIPLEAQHLSHANRLEADGASDLAPYNPSRADILQAISTVYVPQDNNQPMSQTNSNEDNYGY